MPSRLGNLPTNIENVRKEVDSTFGIIKKRWRIQEYGLYYLNIESIDEIFLTCCVLYYMMVKDSKTTEN